jgi:dephospho-CoA kinase
VPARVLLLGGIGSGKSTAADWFAAHGAHVISADDVARTVLAPGTEASATVLAMWPAADAGDGTVARETLGRIVFADPAELAALESIVHPATRAAIREEVADHPDDLVMVEMALLRDWYDDSWLRVVVDAPDDLRIARTIERESAMTADDVRQIMGRQAMRAEWLAVADFVIDNSGDRAALESQCETVWEWLGAA